MEEENTTNFQSEVTIEIDNAEESEEGLIHRVCSYGCQGQIPAKEKHSLPHHPQWDSLCDIEVEPTILDTAHCLITDETIMAEPAVHDTPRHETREDIKTEPAVYQTDSNHRQHVQTEPALHQTAQNHQHNVQAEPALHQTAQNHQQHVQTEPALHQTAQNHQHNVQAEPAVHQPDTEDSEQWRDVGNFTVTLVPVAYSWASSLQQEKQASCPVQWKEKGVTDCCQPEAANEKKQATSVPANTMFKQKPSPHNTASGLLFHATATTPVPEVRVAIPHSCQLCPSAFMLFSNLKRHMDDIHGQKLLSQHSQPSSHDHGHCRLYAKNNEQEVGCLECDACGKVFCWPSHLKRHRLTHIGAKPYVCDVCSKAFTRAYGLKSHKRIHTGETPFVCDICSKGFTVSCQLKQHKLRHSGEKPLICDVCGMGFSQTSKLKKHKVTHTGEKPFVCDVCHKGFTGSFNLKRHKLVHAGQRPFVCDVCNKAFSLAGILKTHKLIHTKSKLLAV